MLGLSVLSQLRIDKSKSADETDNFSCCRLFCGIVRPPPLPLPWGACHTIPVFQPVPTRAFVRGEALWGKLSLPMNTTQAFHYSRQRNILTCNQTNELHRSRQITWDYLPWQNFSYKKTEISDGFFFFFIYVSILLSFFCLFQICDHDLYTDRR